MTPKRSDVEAVSREMERGGDWRQRAYDLASCSEYDRSKRTRTGWACEIEDAAIRLLLRERDAVIRAARKLSRAWCGLEIEEAITLARWGNGTEGAAKFEDAAMLVVSRSDDCDSRRKARRERGRK